MKRPRKLLCFAAALLLGFTLVATPARADTGDATLQISGEPAKLILQLGPGWAGTQFELRTDAGMYPQPVVVGNDGVLRMDLGGSKTYTLSCLQAATQDSTAVSPANIAAAGTAPDHTGTAHSPEAAAPTTDVDLDAFLAGLAEPGTKASVEQPPPREESAQRIVPVKQILIFGGGIIAAVIALVILSRLKKRRVDDDEEEDYED